MSYVINVGEVMMLLYLMHFISYLSVPAALYLPQEHIKSRMSTDWTHLSKCHPRGK